MEGTSNTTLGTEFESLVVQIIDAIFPLSQDSKMQDFFSKAHSEEEIHFYLGKHAQESIRIIHAGFKKAQVLIVDKLLNIQTEHKEAKAQLKEARRKKAEDSNLLLAKVQILEYKESVLKHLADSIFWQLIRGNLHISRRFWQNVPGNKTLEETNYKSVLVVADEINSNPDNFVLMSDITSYVQIADLIGIVDGKMVMIEVKDGEKNREILHDLDAVLTHTLPIVDLFEKYKDNPKDVEQIVRMLKQDQVTLDEIKIINTDKGYDPLTGGNLQIFTPKEDTLYYYDELQDLEKQLATRTFWAYTVVDGCLHIGLYKNKWRFIGKSLLETIAKDQEIEHKIIADARTVMKTMDCPLLFLPFSKQLVLDILLGKVFMYLMLDIDKFLKLHEYFGTVCSWTSRKETARLKERLKNINFYLANNRVVTMKNAYGVESIMTMGVISKILFNHIRPTYMAYTSSYYTKDDFA